MINRLTPLRQKANIRQQLFWYLKGIALRPFISRGINNGSLTNDEVEELESIQRKIDYLLYKQFERSKEVGLKPKRRCHYCGKPANYNINVCGLETFVCDKCFKEIPETDINSCLKINPNK